MIDRTLLKLAVLGVALCGSLLASRVLKEVPATRRWALFAIGILPFLDLQHFSVSFLTDDWYRGDSAGLSVTAVDCLTLALWLALPRSPGPFRWLRWLYFAVALAGLPLSPVPPYAAFSLWKLVRMYALVDVVWTACADEGGPPALLAGMGLGVAWQGVLTLNEHYLLHRYQAHGAFDHQNTLGMACGLVAPVALALVLARPGLRLAWLTLAGASLAVLFSLSRGSLTMMLGAFALVACLSAARELTRRKAALAAVGLLAVALLAVRVWPTWSDRFHNAPRASADGRVQFEQAASLMTADHPFGLGMNQFSWSLEHLGYADRVGLTGHDRGSVVHNIYWLTAAELGWLGLLVYLLLLAAPLWTALSSGLRARDDVRGDVLIGCAAGLIATYGHGTLEWVARQTAFAYVFWAMVALVAAVAHQARAAAAPAPA